MTRGFRVDEHMYIYLLGLKDGLATRTGKAMGFVGSANET